MKNLAFAAAAVTLVGGAVLFLNGPRSESPAIHSAEGVGRQTLHLPQMPGSSIANASRSVAGDPESARIPNLPQEEIAPEEPSLPLEIAPGVLEPIALLEEDGDLSPAQAKTLAEIGDQSLKKVNSAAKSASTDEELSEVWSKEQNDADADYRRIFGDSAATAQGTEAARRALVE